MTTRTRRPKIVIKTHKLMNAHTNKVEEFPLFTDKEIGLGEGWVTDLAIEAREDDDVQTDDEVYDNCMNSIKRELKRAETRVKKTGFNKLVNNINIKKRVAHPENYDREGKFRRPTPQKAKGIRFSAVT